MNKQILVKALKDQAKRIGRTQYFWENMAEAMLSGEVENLDMRDHFRKPQPVPVIIKIMHEHIMPDQPLDDELRAFYRSLLSKILKALDFRDRIND